MLPGFLAAEPRVYVYNGKDSRAKKSFVEMQLYRATGCNESRVLNLSLSFVASSIVVYVYRTL